MNADSPIIWIMWRAITWARNTTTNCALDWILRIPDGTSF